MAPILKHGGHRILLAVQALAAGSSSDTSDLFTYDYNYSAYGVYDLTTEEIIRATLVMAANVTGAATNNFAVGLSHYNAAGSVVDQVLYTFASGTNATAYVPIDLTTIGASVGRTIQQGWLLQPGDTVELKRFTNGTGMASPAFGVTLVLGVRRT
jgi:hypothetical protein